MNVSEKQRRLSLRAEKEEEHQFKDLYSLLYNRDWLRQAHENVSRNKGSITAGCDGINMKDFDENYESNFEGLQQDLKAQTFEPYPVRRVTIPKPDGRSRPLGIPSIRDRIVQEALRMILEPIFEADFSQNSYGFRPNRRTLDAIIHLGLRSNNQGKYFWVIEGDISSYFDTINHRKLLRCIKRRIKDEKILRLIWKFLRAGVMEKKLFRATHLGTPQGGIISPLLANIYLHELDKYMEQYTELSKYEKRRRRERQGKANCFYVRYADDFVVVCNGTKADAKAIREELQEFLKGHLKLKLSIDKTKITHINDGYQFLGYIIRRSTGGNGKEVVRLHIPRSAVHKVTEKIRRTLAPSTTNHSVNTKIIALEQIIGGWCRYYQYASSPARIFSKLDQITYWEMAHWLARKYKTGTSTVIRRFNKGPYWATESKSLTAPRMYETRQYKARSISNPYIISPGSIQREIYTERNWTGYERRPGNWDTRLEILERDGYSCKNCGAKVSELEAQVDHIKPRRRFKRPENADKPENLWTLCYPCHEVKTKLDRQGESRVR